MLRDSWYEARPFVGHALIGMGLACMISTVAIALLASTFGVTGELFFSLTAAVLIVFVTGVIAGAVGIVLYMSPLDRNTYHARHALRRSERL